jgi:iron-sulfur cluster repair protein YtfE (RIC family)
MTEQQRDMNHDRWNIASLKEYFDYAMLSLEEKFEIKLQSLDQKVEKIDKVNDIKHEAMNEVREQLGDQADTFLQTAIYDSKHEIIQNKIEGLQKLVFVGLGVWMVVQGIIVVVLIFIFKK